MVHPTNLLRSDSEGRQGFSAPVGNYLNDIDCGITALPCLAKRLRLEKLAKLSVFLTVLSFLGLLHGIISAYFKGTSQLWFSHYNFPSFMEEWFVFLNEIFVGIFALCISYWGDRLHRVTCLGALTMLIAVSGATLVLPEVNNPFTSIEITNAITGPALCNVKNEGRYTKDILGTEGFNEVTFGYFFVFQIMFSMVTISFTSHGLTYVDDHISGKHSPALLGLAIAANEAGKQFGIYFSWVPYVLKIFSIFSSPVWIFIIIITFFIGVGTAMFPKVLPNMAIKKSVNSLVSVASGRIALEEEIKLSFPKMMWSFLRNKVLLLNIMSFVLMQSALINFGFFEKYFNQSKYHVPMEKKDSTGYLDPYIIQFTTNLLRQPLVAVSIVTCGMIISKLRPKPKNLVIWNIIAFILVVLIFSSTLFWNCTNGIQNENKHVITIPFCSSKCTCPIGESFQPVCVDGKTYFSPCLAGCRNYSATTMMYQNCNCGSVVTAGSCDQDNCKFVLALVQVNNILSNGLVASTLLVNIIITLRSVSTKHKATAIGLELTFLGIIPFIPVKIIYHSIASCFCRINSQKGCQYYSDYFPMVISIITISFMLGAIILGIILLCFIKDLDLYSNEFSSLDIVERNNNIREEIPNTASRASEDNKSVEEDSPFIGERNVQIINKFRSPLSRQERIQTYIKDGELVPPLDHNQKNLRSSGKSEISRSSKQSVSSQTQIEPLETSSKNVAVQENRSSSRNSIVRNSKASGESDMSSLYRFADSIADVSDSNESEPSIKVSQGKIVFQTAPQRLATKIKKNKNEPLIISPYSTQPQRPAPVPVFLAESNL